MALRTREAKLHGVLKLQRVVLHDSLTDFLVFLFSFYPRVVFEFKLFKQIHFREAYSTVPEVPHPLIKSEQIGAPVASMQTAESRRSHASLLCPELNIMPPSLSLSPTSRPLP